MTTRSAACAGGLRRRLVWLFVWLFVGLAVALGGCVEVGAPPPKTPCDCPDVGRSGCSVTLDAHCLCEGVPCACEDGAASETDD